MKAIFLRGQRELVKYPVASSTVIEAGDMLWYDGAADTVKPASDFDFSSSLAATQAGFAAVFAGIAVEKSEDGDTDPVSVDISAESVYVVDVPSAAYKGDSTLGPDQHDSDEMADQKLELAVAASSIARSLKNETTTRLEVHFHSALGVSNNVNANLG